MLYYIQYAKLKGGTMPKETELALELDKWLNMDKYGLMECPNCNGYGSSLKEHCDKCTKCGGSGVVDKRKE